MGYPGGAATMRTREKVNLACSGHFLTPGISYVYVPFSGN
jgi:hypothetical protein